MHGTNTALEFSMRMRDRHGRTRTMTVRQIAEIVAVSLSLEIIFLAALTWLWTPECAWAQEAKKSAADVEVLVYGGEQALVDAVAKSRNHPADQKSPNELDKVLSILLARAYPRPEAKVLMRHTMDAICEDFETRTHTKISDSQRMTWEDTALQTKSFEPVLKDMERIATRPAKRKQLVNAGLTAMLRATGSMVAGVLDVSQAEGLTNLMEARNAPSREHGTLGLDVSGWPTIKVVPGAAADAGLRDGDVVLQVDATDVAEIRTSADALKLMRGTAGTTINLTIKRGNQTLNFDVRRASAADRIKAILIDPHLVDIRIPTFEGSGIAKRVNELIRQQVNDATAAVILDVRDNSAGRPEEANAVADIFLDEKYLQIFQFRDGRQIAFKSKPGALGVRVIVLTNHNTASCAEMLTLALHDNHRATVIGQRTAGALFGKDVEKLDDKRMVIFRSEPTVLSATGRDYSEVGIPPDILVGESKDSGKDKVLARAIEFVRTGS